MHGEFEEFFVVLTEIPTVLLHFLAELVELVGEVRLWVLCLKLTTLFLGHLHELRRNGARQLTSLAENHVPDGVGNHAPTLLALFHLHHVHQGEVLHILGEWSYQAGITHLWPYVSHFVEELDEQVVGSQLRLTVLHLPLVQRLEVVLQVGHQRTHHAAWKTWLHEQRVVDVVEVGDIVAEEVIAHLLNLSAHLHVGSHVDFLHLEASVLQHLLHGDDVSVTSTPREWRHTSVDVVTTSVADFEDGSHVEARASVRVVLNHDVLLQVLDASHNLAERYRTADTCHVFQTDFVSTGIDKLLGEVHVVFNSVDRGVGDAERSLGNHASLLCILDGRNHVAWVVQTAEDAGDVRALCLLHLIEELAHILWNWAHAQSVQSAVEHVSLDASLMERLCPFAHRLVGVFSVEEVHLLETTTVCFNTVETSHLDDGWSHFYELVHTRLILTSTLPHVAEDQREFYFFCHIFFTLNFYLQLSYFGCMTLATSNLTDGSVDDSLCGCVDAGDCLLSGSRLLGHSLFWSPLVHSPDEQLAEVDHDEQHSEHREHTNNKELQSPINVICNHMM